MAFECERCGSNLLYVDHVVDRKGATLRDIDLGCITCGHHQYLSIDEYHKRCYGRQYDRAAQAR